MRSIFVFVVPFMIFASSVTGQVPLTEPCPEISVIGPQALMGAGESAVFSAIADPKGLPVELTFTWDADGGRIEDGQGSTEVRVKRTEGKYLSVWLKVDGMRPRCEKRFGATLYPDTWSSEPKLIKAFSDWEEATRDGVFDEIPRQNRQFPLGSFFVLSCGPPNDLEWLKRTGDQLMDGLKEAFGYHPPRFTIITGTGVPHTIQIWMTEVGDKAPDVERCSDTALRSSSDPTKFLAQEKKCAGVEYGDKNQVTPEALYR